MEIFVGGQIIHSNSSQKMSPTTPYIYDDITWCVQKANLRDPIENIIYMLDIEMWIIQVSMYAFMGAVCFYILRFDNMFKCYVWNVLLFLLVSMGLPSHYKPRNWFVRFFYILTSVYGLQWNAVCCAFFLSILYKPHLNWQLANLQDALYYDFRLTVPDNYYIPSVLVRIVFSSLNYKKKDENIK